MKTVNTLALYWGPRFETAEQCARRLEETFVAFSSCHNLLSNWYLKSSTRKKAMETERISRVDIEQLTALVSKGVNRRDDDRAPMSELGFRVSLWNKGKSTDAASFSVNCGLHSTVAGLTNSLVVKLPKSIDYTSEVNVQMLTDLLISLVRVWEPDWGVIYDTNSANWWIGKKELHF